MASVVALLRKAERNGVRVELGDDGEVKVRATDAQKDLVDQLRPRKAEILSYLSGVVSEADELPPAPIPRQTSDLGNAERFAAQHGGKVRYIHAWDKWLVYSGSRWEIDVDGSVMRLAKETARSIYHEAAGVLDEGLSDELSKWAKTSQSRARLESMLQLAKSEQPIPISHESLDSDPWLLNFHNGTVDLRNGRLRPHDRGDLLTKTTGIEYPDEPGVDAILWRDFLNTIFAGDVELIRYLQRLMGSALPGVVMEHVLPIFYGHGANGKSVFIETVMAALGEYAMKAPAGLLMAQRGERHPTELCDLFGMRLVAVTETGAGQKLDERLVKEVTGGDTIRARRMREDFWQFKPSHTLVMVTNHKPIVRGTDYGIWRRLRLVPFTVTIPPEQQDKRLPERLRCELPAILRWMVEGCVEWQRTGLSDPIQVMAATDAYKTESDTFAEWFKECMIAEPSAVCRASEAFASYQKWGEDNGERNLLGRRGFGERMGERIDGKLMNNGTWYQGVGLLEHPKSDGYGSTEA
jgi:putative DNA primase/helicase